MTSRFTFKLFCAVAACAICVGSDFRPVVAADAQQTVETAELPDYCSDFEAFSARFIRPPFPENAPADEQKNWYALKKTCGRDLIKLSLAKWPAFEAKPSDFSEETWEKFTASVALARAELAKMIFDEDHGGTLIKKYYSTDYEPDKIVALDAAATETVAKIDAEMSALTSDVEWKAARRCEFDLFRADFNRWFVPYSLASLSKLPPAAEYPQNPDLFLAVADLLEFAVDYIPDEPAFVETLAGVQEQLRAPKAVEIRVFHGRFEGFDLVSRDVIFARYCARIEAVAKKREEKRINPELTEADVFNGRQTEKFVHGSLPQWGAADPNQQDYMYVVFPKTDDRANRPLYVVLHSAGHSARTALNCTPTVGNHDIYTVPDDFFGLFIDCFDNKKTDWWWGGRRADEPEINDANRARATSELQPVEKRALDEIAWAIDKYGIDSNRVYLCGNSMGGSGTLGFGLSNGAVFAAIKANVPAGVWHAYDRLGLGEENPPERLVDPPVCFDYSAQNDKWSDYHEALIKGAEDRKFAYVLYWGVFGHENNDQKVAAVNDLFKTFDWTSIRKNEAYPAFTRVSTDDPSPWPKEEGKNDPGQRGAYFRWKVLADTADAFEIELKLASADELASKIFEIPVESTADVSIRRLQEFKVKPGEKIEWFFGDKSGTATADPRGLVTVPELTVKTEPGVLKLTRAAE